MPDSESPPARPGLESNLAALLAVCLPPLSGIVALKMGREDAFVRFHAVQSIVFGFAVLLGYGAIYGLAVTLRESGQQGAAIIAWLGAVFVAAWTIIWVVQMGAALLKYQWQIPILGRIARRFSKP